MLGQVFGDVVAQLQAWLTGSLVEWITSLLGNIFPTA